MKTRGIRICKISSESSEPSETEIRAQVSGGISDDIIGSKMTISSDGKTSSDKIPEIRAQNSVSDDTDDILHTLHGKEGVGLKG
jgi:hypothetical protein